MAQQREFGIMVYGASGYTGRLVAEYLTARYGVDGEIRWAMAGRNEAKLAAVRDEVGAPAGIPLVLADADDPASLKAMAERAQVVLTTVGPYQLYGSGLVAACAATGTDYVDLCGEPNWMRDMIDAHDAEAKQTGARIVLSCGFDSIPFDLGVLRVQKVARARFGAPVPRVKGRVRSMSGTFSGGTAASARATMAALSKAPELLDLIRSPWALTPGFEGPEQPHGMAPMEDPGLGEWVAPFMMAVINCKNVHRSNLLMDHAYGTDFVYDEMMVTGPGEAGKAAAEALAGANPMGGRGGPRPGEGPSREEREAGSYDILFLGEAADGRTVRVVVTGDRDPGYGSTSKMVAESAACLVEDVPEGTGSIVTAAPVMGEPLTRRLVEHAGLTFEVED